MFTELEMCAFALSLNFSLSIEKLKVSGFINSFEDGTMLKIPFEITSLLIEKRAKRRVQRRRDRKKDSTCSECGKIFGKDSELKKHIATKCSKVRTLSKTRCSICKEVFESKQYIYMQNLYTCINCMLIKVYKTEFTKVLFGESATLSILILLICPLTFSSSTHFPQYE